jgi:hypothetical protein
VAQTVRRDKGVIDSPNSPATLYAHEFQDPVAVAGLNPTVVEGTVVVLDGGRLDRLPNRRLVGGIVHHGSARRLSMHCIKAQMEVIRLHPTVVATFVGGEILGDNNCLTCRRRAVLQAVMVQAHMGSATLIR